MEHVSEIILKTNFLEHLSAWRHNSKTYFHGRTKISEIVNRKVNSIGKRQTAEASLVTA